MEQTTGLPGCTRTFAKVCHPDHLLRVLMNAGVVDVCLIPEVPFNLEKLLSYVGTVLEKKGNAVVCVAEGAGQVGVGCERAGCCHITCIIPLLPGTP